MNQHPITDDDDRIYVHLIPHTHDDVGNEKTVDQYYTGSGSDISMADVSAILDLTIPELINDPKKRFIYAEMKYFSMWFYRQSEEMKEAVRGLVR